MTVFQELQHLRRALVRFAFCFILLLIIFFTVPFGTREIGEIKVFMPTAGGETIASQVLERMTERLVPKGVEVVAFNPFDPFVAQTILASLLALLLSLPLLALEVWMFVAPGLYPHERRALGIFSVAAATLLILGAAFGYYIFVPAVFAALYSFSISGAPLFFSLRELVSLTAGLVFVTALIFLLPVGMTLLSSLGLVKPEFWRSYARHALLLALILSAIITPDGSGVSMVLLSVPICGLYAVGYAGSTVFARSSNY